MTWAAGWKTADGEIDAVHEHATWFWAWNYLKDTIEHLREEDWREYPDEPVDEWWHEVEHSLNKEGGHMFEPKQAWSATSKSKIPVTLWMEER